MKSTASLFLIALSFFGTAIGAERAVESVHYEVGLNGAYTDYDEDLDDVFEPGVSGAITVPLGKYFGASLDAGYRKYKFEDSFDYFHFESDTAITNGALKFFARNPSLGKIGIGYEQTKVNSSATGYSSYPGFSYTYSYRANDTSDQYSAFADYYVGPVSLSMLYMEHSYRGPEDEIVNGVFLDAKWYVIPSLSVSGGLGLFDAADSYRAQVEFQPEFIGNRLGFTLGLLNGGNVNQVKLSVNYYFNKRIDLKTRDRHYR